MCIRDRSIGLLDELTLAIIKQTVFGNDFGIGINDSVV